jgi:hypothetical protein
MNGFKDIALRRPYQAAHRNSNPKRIHRSQDSLAYKDGGLNAKGQRSLPFWFLS